MSGIQFGPTASIFTSDLGTAPRLARDVEAGYVWTNDTSRYFPGAPFGGLKNSGVGREDGFDEPASSAQLENMTINFAPGEAGQRLKPPSQRIAMGV
jgi:betaine-aldehyde dehydrogenase